MYRQENATELYINIEETQESRLWNFTYIILFVIGLDWCWHSDFFLICHRTGCPDCAGQLQPLPQQLLPVSLNICSVQWPRKQPLGFNTLYCMSVPGTDWKLPSTHISDVRSFPTLIKIEANRLPGRICSVLNPWICTKPYLFSGNHALMLFLKCCSNELDQ